MKFVILLSTIILHLSIYSQTILNATSQGWAGGVCCRTGTNYVVTIEFEKEISSAEIRAIWLGYNDKLNGYIYNPNGDFPTKQLIISFGKSTDYNEMILKEEFEERNINEIVRPRFEGLALIELVCDKKDFQIVVNEFESLPYIAYP